MNESFQPQDVYQATSLGQGHFGAAPGGPAFGPPPPGAPPRPGGPPPGGPWNGSPQGMLYYPVVIQNRSSFWSILLFFLFGFLAVGVCGFFFLSLCVGIAASAAGEESGSPVNEKFISGNRTARDKIAIMTISGTILGNDEGFVKKQIAAITADHRVKAVVLRINSPGGTVSGSDYYLEQLRKMKTKRDIPIIVSMGALAASGGYYVAMVGDELFAEPTTTTGSIGVILPMYNLAGLCEKIGVQSDPIASGPLKGMGDITKPLSEEERKILQSLVDDSFSRFKTIIREGRPKFAEDPEKLDALATGQVYTANQALENGLIDEIGFLEDATDRAIKQAGLTANNSKVILYKNRQSFSELMMSDYSQESSLQNHLLKILATPQPYYILPGALPEGER